MSTHQSTSSDHLTKAQVVGLLQHRHRRAVIAFLKREQTGRARFDDLVEYVLSTSPREDSSADRRQQIKIGLLHNHLPRLADAGLLEYDRRSETVRYWGDSRFEPFLEAVSSDEFPQ